VDIKSIVVTVPVEQPYGCVEVVQQKGHRRRHEGGVKTVIIVGKRLALYDSMTAMLIFSRRVKPFVFQRFKQGCGCT
jgi:hypothetical protein